MSLPETGPRSSDTPADPRSPDRLEIESIEAELREVAARLPGRLALESDDVEHGLAQLVLTLVEFLRRILEHQAVRRMEEGRLSDEEVERLGLALLRLQEQVDELRSSFGLSPRDLNVDLGPFGRLL